MVAIAQRPAAAGSDSPFPDNRSWEVDRVVLAQASERRAWFVAWGALALAAIGGGGGALAIYTAFEHRTEVVPVIVDRATGKLVRYFQGRCRLGRSGPETQDSGRGER